LIIKLARVKVPLPTYVMTVYKSATLHVRQNLSNFQPTLSESTSSRAEWKNHFSNNNFCWKSKV